MAKGETLVIIGRSGGGKSVLLKHLIGLMTPDAGQIRIDGENIIGLTERKLAAIRLKVGILFQGGALFDSMTVEENIAFPLHEAGERDAEKIGERVREMLDVIELEGDEKKMPVNLMVLSVGLARSTSAPVLRLYENRPPVWTRCVGQHNRLIRRLQKRYGMKHRGHARHEKRISHRDHTPSARAGFYFYVRPQELEISNDPLIQTRLIRS